MPSLWGWRRITEVSADIRVWHPGIVSLPRNSEGDCPDDSIPDCSNRPCHRVYVEALVELRRGHWPKCPRTRTLGATSCPGTTCVTGPGPTRRDHTSALRPERGSPRPRRRGRDLPTQRRVLAHPGQRALIGRAAGPRPPRLPDEPTSTTHLQHALTTMRE